jgi:hypothetical protein
VFRWHTGLDALDGGSFEEVVRPPLGNCSINTHKALSVRPLGFNDSDYVKLGVSDTGSPSGCIIGNEMVRRTRRNEMVNKCNTLAGIGSGS